MTPIRVVLADDHAVVRKGIRDFLEEDGEIEVVAEAADGETVKDLIRLHQPDVAILDIQMPGATGIEVAHWIQEQALPVKVLIMTAYDDEPFVVAALQAGAHGYLLKNAEADEMTGAVRSVYHGQPALAPCIAQKLMAHMAGNKQSNTGVEPVTDRERATLQYAALGLTNRGIGLKLAISDRTVQGHLASIYGKLHVGSRTEAVMKALQLGMIQLSETSA